MGTFTQEMAVCQTLREKPIEKRNENAKVWASLKSLTIEDSEMDTYLPDAKISAK